jgi:vitamin B12 transporter
MRAVGCFLLVLCAVVGAARADGRKGPGHREEVIVTAARTPTALRNAGSSATVITREQIERRNPVFLIDLLRDVPGFAVGRAGGSGKFTQLRVRGAEANHVLVLIDGIEANDITRADEFDFAHLGVDDIERVEIVRGPQSALWGSDALAGVVNVITRRGAGAVNGNASAEYGSFGTERLSASVGAGDERRDGSVAVSYIETGGINIAQRGDEEDGYRNATLNTRLGWQALPTLRLEFTGRLTDVKTATDGDTGLGVPSDTDGETDILQAYAQGRARWSTFNDHWLHELSGAWSKMDNADLDRAVFLEGEVVGHKHSIDYQTTLQGTTAVVLPASHALTFALDYEQQRFRQRGPVTIFGNPNQDRDYQILGYAGEYRLTVADNTTLGASGRWDDNSEFADVGTFRVFATHDFTRSGTTVSAALATGQKAPTFFDRFGFSFGGLFSPTFIGNAGVRPETSRGWEVGLTQALLAERVALGVTWFSERLEDEINGFVVDPATFSATAVNLDGRSRRDGVELTVKASLGRQIDLNTSYTWLDATQPDRATGTDIVEVRRPRHQLAASANWTSRDRRAGLDLHLTHTGAGEDDSFPPPFFAASRVALDPYTLLGLAGRYRVNPHLSLLARIENVLDDDYQDVFGFETEGLSAHVGVKLSTAR